jgi:hypothetical protein
MRIHRRDAEIAEISAEKKKRERERYTFGLARRSFRNVAAAGACGFLPGVFRPPVIWLESTKT